MPRNWNIAIVLSILAAGCAKKPEESAAKVRGVVTFQGRSVVGGIIVFVPDRDKGCSGQMHTAIIGQEGLYALESKEPIKPGWYRIAMSDPPQWYGSDWERAFPAQLRRPDQSGIEKQIQPGDNVFDFQIELTE